ncbi:hypothetical protein [Roseixanthobacter liquoris]|uniref:hypothetical protein n=1 Tax=Roseixanthobacter liquoris TaxID=3119921 RepID=UPI00372895B8
MDWLHEASLFLGGAVLTNAVPHFVSGVMGRAFQSPFARPPGEGLSSATVNVVWGIANLVIAYLILRAGTIDLGALDEAAALGAGMLVAGVLLARRFGRFNGGNLTDGA